MNQHKSIIRRIFYNSIIILIAITFSLFLCDWILALFKYSSEPPRRISHPKNIEAVRKNIEFEYLFKTNDQGLRYRTIPRVKTANQYRIFVSGDSYTEGFGVDAEHRFTDLLEDKFKTSSKSILFINGGLGGTGTLEHGRLFLNIGLKYNPDALLICVFPNDLSDTPKKLAPNALSATPHLRFGVKKIAYTFWPHVYTLLKKFHHKRIYLSKTRTTDFISTITRQAEKRNIPQSRITAWKVSLPQDLVEAVNQDRFMGYILSGGLLYPKRWIDTFDIASDSAEKKWQNMTLILSKILARAQQNGIEAAMVFIPSPLLYDSRQYSEKNPLIITGTEIHQRWLAEDTEIQKRLRLWADEKGVPYLDLTPTFRKAFQANKDLNFPLDGHWNNLGHQVAAGAIASWLSDQKVFSFIRE
jgi:lysophospholipase L1-like esterase